MPCAVSSAEQDLVLCDLQRCRTEAATRCDGVPSTAASSPGMSCKCALDAPCSCVNMLNAVPASCECSVNPHPAQP